jgi:uncharacterized protein (DUF58 family)
MRKTEVHIDVTPRIHHLQVATRYLVATNFMGNYTSVFKGRGIEFADYRKYEPSDDASAIDWKASLRAGDTLVREYQEERNLNLLFLLDSSASMIFGSHEKLKHEYAAELVASMTMGALAEGDSVGLSMFNERVVARVNPYVGRQQLYLMLRNLVNPKNYGGKCNYSQALEETSAMLEKHSILMIVSDFIGFTEADKRFLRTASRKYDTVALIVRDPRDNELPQGLNLVTVCDPYTERQMVVDVDKIREEFAENVAKEISELQVFFRQNRINHVFLDTSKPFIAPVIKFFKERKEKCR